MRTIRSLGCATWLAAAVGGLSPGFAQKPNIVHILADDLGYGSVGFNGPTQIQTPTLDALAAAGMRFNNAYAASVCGPSRAMLYSGFHNGHTLVDRNSNLNGEVFRDDGQTLGDHLMSAGYRTAIFGKWGFGGTGSAGEGLKPNPVVDGPDSLPTAQGFESFYGYLDHARAHSYRVDSLWTTEEPRDDDNNGVHEVGEKYQANPDHGLWLEKTGNHPGNENANYTADLVTQKALAYIASRAQSSEPFYLQYASTIPHFDIDAIRSFPGWFDAYSGVPGAAAWTDDQKAYAAMITRLDQAVGQIVDKLDDPNSDGDHADSVLANTLIVLTSDNGATPEDNSPVAFFNASGGKRGGKRDLWDGGINVPTFAYWQGAIAPGQVSDRYTDLSDFMPTALELAGVRGPVGMDGVSIAHELIGAGPNRQRPFLVFEQHERDHRWAIIKDDHKLIKYSDGSMRLYDLINDPGEANELSLADARHAAMAAEFQAIAIAEGVEQGDAYTVEFRQWSGGDGDEVASPDAWTAPGTPGENWSAVLANQSSGPHTAYVRSNVATLGFEVRGNGPGATQEVRVESGAILTGRNEVRVSEHGLLHLDGGTVASVRWLDVLQHGELSGAGTVAADVYNFGTIAPGEDPTGTDLIRIEGDYFQTSTGRLRVEVAGLTGGQQFEQLAVTGAATLAGALDVAFASGFEPVDGDFFPLLLAGEVLQSFDTVVLPSISGGVELSVQYTDRLVVLVAGDWTLIDGDVNLDGALNQADVDAFIAGWLHTQAAPDVNSYTKGDLNLDGKTNREDWRLLRDAFQTAGLGSPRFGTSQVPEPGAGWLLVLAGSLVLGKLRRGSRYHLATGLV
ncbi:Arylsulfatase [Pirellulimonas nuda]|uniref:Arylsulfatase n=1 Tax=Pirellulimonas nuda TaxID=2528009 RepID=A0A518DAN4_9BACT|nr:sulfatase-like hydrolase/transferase [Pirellulimonas nuda]QDU88547.1 Arylsulfatase [Pirellulimonas nuda]